MVDVWCNHVSQVNLQPRQVAHQEQEEDWESAHMILRISTSAESELWADEVSFFWDFAPETDFDSIWA